MALKVSFGLFCSGKDKGNTKFSTILKFSVPGDNETFPCNPPLWINSSLLPAWK